MISPLCAVTGLKYAARGQGRTEGSTGIGAPALAGSGRARSCSSAHVALSGQSDLVEELLVETRRERAQLEGILNTIDTQVAVLDATGRFTIVNRALADARGSRVVVGASAFELAPVVRGADGVTPIEESPFTRGARGERINREVMWWQRTDDERIAYRASAEPLPDGAGSVVALHDITDELEALAQREDFVSSVSHELRTPLTSITGYLELAQDEPGLPDAARRHLDVADRNAARLQVLIDNLLTAARTRAEAASRQDTDLHAVVRDVVESQALRAADRGVAITVAADGRCVVRGDAARLFQVVDNLVSNAVKYTGDGGHVRLTLSAPADGDSRVRLEVADDGIGIALTVQQRIFSRYYRAPAVRQTAVQGTGLGLHISRQIIEALGGSVSLTSELGRGTTVTVELPAGER